MRWSRLICAVGLLSLVCPSLRADDAVNVVSLGKAATALVEIPDGKGTASACCILKSGIFITNWHVAREVPSGRKLKLIFNGTSDNRRVVPCDVLRVDEKVDLAVLKAAGEQNEEFPTLKLGDDGTLFETAPITAFGFPFGKSLSLEKKSYPEMSINVGRVTSLRKHDGKLDVVQIDAQVNPGNSGGPVLDEHGKIVGIVAAGVPGSGVNFAVPVRCVWNIITAPDVDLKFPSRISRDDQAAEQEFKAVLKPFLRPLHDVTVELELTRTGSPTRKLKAVEGENHTFTVKTVPLSSGDSESDQPASNRPISFALIVSQQGNELARRTGKLFSNPIGETVIDKPKEKETAETKSQTASAGSRSGDTETIIIVRPKPGVTTTPPRPVPGRPTTTPTTRPQEVVIITRHKPGTTGTTGTKSSRSPTSTDSASEGFKLKRREGDAPTFVAYTGEKKIVNLPDAISDVVMGGGGRYLFCNLPKLRKIAVYDVNKAAIDKFISVSSDEVLMAAGLDKLILVSPTANVIERWSLATFERETAVPFPLESPAQSITLGYAATNPLLVATGGEIHSARSLLFDIDTLKPVEGGAVRLHNCGDGVHYRASGLGDVFGIWCTNHSPQGLETMILAGAKAESHYEHNSAGFVVPNSDGTRICTAIAGVCKPELSGKITESHEVTMPSVPSTHPRFYVSVPGDPDAQRNLAKPFSGPATLRQYGVQAPIGNLPDLELGKSVESVNSGRKRTDFTLDKRVWYIQQADQIVSVPYSNDRLIVQRVNLKDILDSKGLDYLFVMSSPPSSFVPGSLFEYQLQVASHPAKVQYALSSGPPGMTLSGSGMLTWSVPKTFAEHEIDVIITLKNDAISDTFETFKVTRAKK